jgi:Kef-type K+ transport system membrane component KefB
MAISGATKLAAGGSGPRSSGLRLVLGYAVMVAALAATLLGSFTLGSRLEPVPNAAGVYRLDPPARCLGGRIEVWQSGRFTDIAGERGSGGSLELDGRQLTGKVGCADGSTAPLQATMAGDAGDRSLSGEVGGHRFRATRIRDHPEPAEAEVASDEHLRPEALFGRLMLAIAVVILAARAVGALAGRLGQPKVMGEVLAGILLGPTLLGALLPDVEAYLFPAQVIPLLSAAADLGLALYMFLVGLEQDPRLLRGRLAQAAFVSTASVAVPMLLAAALALPLFPLLGADTGYAPFALFLGAALSITAFPVLARILVERRMLKRQVGAMAMASAALNDVAAWFLLAIAVAAATPAGSLLGAFRILGLAVLFSAAMALVVRRLVGRVTLAYDQAGHVPASWVAAILVGVLLSAYVASWIGLAAIFGAFVMGLILPRRADLTQEVTRRLEDVVVIVLLPLFFVVTGLRVQLGLLDRPVLWLLTAALFGVAVAGKWLGASVAARYAGLPGRESMALGALMNTRGLTELIVVTVGLNYGVVSPALFTMLVLVALVTTFMAGPALGLIDPRGELSVPPEEELRAAPPVLEPEIHGPVPERSVLVAPLDEQNLDALVALAGPLARSHPSRGVILARLLRPPRVATGGPIAAERELVAASQLLDRRRAELVRRRIAARAMACISPDPGQDLVRLASLREVDLVLVDGRRPLLGQSVPRGDPGTSLAEAPSDVACLVGPSGRVPDIGPDRPVVVPFGGAAHDWAALELGAHVASTYGAPIRLLGTTVDPMAGQRGGTDPLADAALVVEQLTGVATEPVLVSPAEVEKLGRDAGLLAVGISRRWQVEGLGVLHAEVARTVPTHVLFVRRGTRSGMLTWPPQGRDLPGLLGVGVPYRTGTASDGVGATTNTSNSPGDGVTAPAVVSPGRRGVPIRVQDTSDLMGPRGSA